MREVSEKAGNSIHSTLFSYWRAKLHRRLNSSLIVRFNCPYYISETKSGGRERELGLLHGSRGYLRMLVLCHNLPLWKSVNMGNSLYCSAIFHTRMGWGVQWHSRQGVGWTTPCSTLEHHIKECSCEVIQDGGQSKIPLAATASMYLKNPAAFSLWSALVAQQKKKQLSVQLHRGVVVRAISLPTPPFLPKEEVLVGWQVMRLHPPAS